LWESAIKEVLRVTAVPATKQQLLGKLLKDAIREAWRGFGAVRLVPRRREVQRQLDRARVATGAETVQFVTDKSRSARMARAFIACFVQPLEISEWLESTRPEQRDYVIDRCKDIAERDLMDGGRTP
jgi:hypothetical protein